MHQTRPPNPTTRYRLPTPTAHLELEQGVYEGYGTSNDPLTVAKSYDDDDDVAVSNGRICHSPGTDCNPPTPDAQPPIPPPFELDIRDTMGDHIPHTTSPKYPEHEGSIAPMEPDHDIVIEQSSHTTTSPWATRT